MAGETFDWQKLESLNNVCSEQSCGCTDGQSWGNFKYLIGALNVYWKKSMDRFNENMYG